VPTLPILDMPPDRAERERIVPELDRTMLVEAAAGTGKTTCLVARMVALLREGRCTTDTLSAVTFTRKAAAELRGRFQIELEQAAATATGPPRERLSAALAHIDRAFIGTIHSFCGRLLRERPIEAGVDMGFAELEDAEDAEWLSRAWSEFVAQLFSSSDPLVGELGALGLEFSELEDAFGAYAGYSDVSEWPAPAVELGDLAAVTQQVRDYVEHMRQLCPTFPVQRGNDKLMLQYERIVRLAEHLDLATPRDLMQLLTEFKPKVYVVQGNWPGRTAAGAGRKGPLAGLCCRTGSANTRNMAREALRRRRG